MTKIKNLFSKIWDWIKKFIKVCSNFLRENVWASVLGIVVAILLFILVVQGVVKGIDKCSNASSESTIANRATTLTTSEVMEKLNKGHTFVLFLGANTCSHCKEFYKTINTYVKSGNTVYYVDLADTSDPTLLKYQAEFEERLLDGVPTDRGITSLATPTTIYVKDGEFVDAVQGAYGMEGGANYAIFCDVVEGRYVGKSTYTFETK